MSYSLFIEAVRNGDVNGVMQEFRVDFLNQSDEHGHLPIHIICQNDSLDVFKFLWKQNCDIESRAHNEWRPIHFAISNENLMMAKILIGFGCELKETDEILMNLINQTNSKEFSDLMTTAIKNSIIGKEMELKCSFECDHKFCLQSICFNEFKEGEFISKGLFGKITKVCRSNDNHEFAIKKVSWEPVSNENIKTEALYIEKNINEYRFQLIHERISKYYGAIIIKCKMFIFMDFYCGKSIDDLIIRTNGSLPDEKSLKYIQQILEGLKFLHEAEIIHRDLKPPNVLLDECDNCKLTDMGCSRLIQSVKSHSNKQYIDNKTKKSLIKYPLSKHGTANYMAPEMIRGDPYDYKVDIWSAGATLFEMLTGETIFSGQPQNKVFMSIGNGKLPDYKNKKPNPNSKIISLLDSMFTFDPHIRPSAVELLTEYF